MSNGKTPTIKLSRLTCRLESAVRQSPYRLRCRAPRRKPSDVRAVALQICHRRIIIPLNAEQLAAPLEGHDVGLQLVVQAWLRERFCRVHALVKDVPEMLDHFGDDVRAAG